MAAREAERPEERGTGKYEQLRARCKGPVPVPTAVAHPCDESSPGAAVEAAEIVLGAPVPIVLASRADNQRTRAASCAGAALYAQAWRASVAG